MPRLAVGGASKGRAFCKLTQDGDDEGCFGLDRLPDDAEAEAIRDQIGIRKRRHMTAAALSKLERARGSIKSPNLAPGFRAGARGGRCMRPVPELRDEWSRAHDTSGRPHR